jgi:SAM-dependent methyltransferase
MDQSVEGFFTKNAEQAYIDQYDKDHSPRLINLIERFKINERFLLKHVVDVGGGLGFLGKRLKCQYTVFDGAFIPDGKKLTNGLWKKYDLDYEHFGDSFKNEYPDYLFDAAFCLETLEHLTNPYNCLVEIKKVVKENGDIYISIPHANVWHNFIYAALMIDRFNFEQFLGQMALPVLEYHLWDKGWNAHTWRCRNAPWTEAKMLYPKDEPKFYGKTPVEYVNL